MSLEELDSRKVKLLGDIISGKPEGRINEKQTTLFTGSGAGGSAGLGI